MHEKQFYVSEISRILHVGPHVLDRFIRNLRTKSCDREQGTELISEYEIRMFMTHILHVDYTGMDTLTNWWLQHNDPYYCDDRKNKRKSVEYSYETHEQQRRRERQEFSFSSLYLPQLYELKGKQLEVDYYITIQQGTGMD